MPEPDESGTELVAQSDAAQLMIPAAESRVHFISSVVSRSELTSDDASLCDRCLRDLLDPVLHASTHSVWAWLHTHLNLAVWWTAGFQVVICVTQFNIDARWRDFPNAAHGTCIAFEVLNNIIFKLWVGAVNIQCFYASRACYSKLLESAQPQKEVGIADEREWRLYIRGFSLNAVVLAVGSVLVYTPLWGPSWFDSGGSALQTTLAATRATAWIQPTLYVLGAPVQNLINQAVPWCFITMHALVVKLVLIRTASPDGKLMRMLNGHDACDLSDVLDEYYEIADRLRALMGALRKFGAFDSYITYLAMHAVFMTVKVFFKMLDLKISGVAVYASGSDPMEPSCFLNISGNATQDQNEELLHGLSLAANWVSVVQQCYTFLVVLLLLGLGNRTLDHLLTQLPFAVEKVLGKGATPLDKHYMCDWLRDCMKTDPIEFRVVGVYMGWGKVLTLLGVQMLPLLYKAFNSILDLK